MIDAVQQNAAYLSEIDGAIGDGDHGINMGKGFTRAGQQIEQQREVDLAAGLDILGNTLFTDIGGAMGPLYGTMFMDMAEQAQGKDDIDAATFGLMLEAALNAVRGLGDAKVGDKTLLDTLVPAERAFKTALASGASFSAALEAMTDAAETGWQSTRDLVARIGRASRLGERSRGHLDAGATSCYLILQAMGTQMQVLLHS
jgi:dihydroxyacetone kinase phosphoprotein-dependent L subunit